MKLIYPIQYEVEICRAEQPFEIKVGSPDENPGSPSNAMETESSATEQGSSVDPVQPSTSSESNTIVVQTPTKTGKNGKKNHLANYLVPNTHL